MKMKLKMLLIALLFGANLWAQESDVDSVYNALEEWVETKRLISQENRKAREQTQLLSGRIELMKSQVDDVKARTAETAESLTEVEEKRGDLDKENAALDEALAELGDRIAAMEARTLALLKTVPEIAQLKIKKLSQQIPRDPEKTEVPLSTRYMNVIGTLDYLNSFNNMVTLEEELRELEPGKQTEVFVIYFGLGQAYFCNESQTIGGVGYPGPEGWQWDRLDEIAEKVGDCIAHYGKDKAAAYDLLPFRVVNLAGGAK
jgi:hypothetical protein